MTIQSSNTPARPSPDLQAVIGSEWEPREPSDTLIRIRIEDIVWGHPLRVRVSRLRPDSERYIGGWDLSWRHITLARVLTHYRPIEPPDIRRWISSVVGRTPLRTTRYHHILADDSVDDVV